MRTARIGAAVVVSALGLTLVAPAGGSPYWLSELGLVGIDDGEGRTSWSMPIDGRWEVVSVRPMTVEQSRILEALVVLAPGGVRYR